MTGGRNVIKSNGVTAVNAVGTPTADVSRYIGYFQARNTGGSTRVITLTFYDGSTEVFICSKSLAANAELIVVANPAVTTADFVKMIVLASTSDVLRAKLDGGTNEVEIYVSFADQATV